MLNAGLALSNLPVHLLFTNNYVLHVETQIWTSTAPTNTSPHEVIPLTSSVSPNTFLLSECPSITHSTPTSFSIWGLPGAQRDGTVSIHSLQCKYITTCITLPYRTYVTGFGKTELASATYAFPAGIDHLEQKSKTTATGMLLKLRQHLVEDPRPVKQINLL